VITGRGCLTLDDRLRVMAEAAPHNGDVLLYGYPVLLALIPGESPSQRLASFIPALVRQRYA